MSFIYDEFNECIINMDYIYEMGLMRDPLDYQMCRLYVTLSSDGMHRSIKSFDSWEEGRKYLNSLTLSIWATSEKCILEESNK